MDGEGESIRCLMQHNMNELLSTLRLNRVWQFVSKTILSSSMKCRFEIIIALFFETHIHYHNHEKNNENFITDESTCYHRS